MPASKRVSSKIKANFNGDLMGVAADKVQNLEIASVGSHDSVLSNGEKVERILRSVDRQRSATDMVELTNKKLSFQEMPQQAAAR